MLRQVPAGFQLTLSVAVLVTAGGWFQPTANGV